MSVANKGVPTPLQSAATTGNGTVVTAPVLARYHTVMIKGVGTIAAGVVSIEEADAEDYTGTWSVIQTVSPTSNAQTHVHVIGRIQAIRARISTTVTGGGTVSVNYVGDV